MCIVFLFFCAHVCLADDELGIELSLELNPLVIN